MRRNLKPLIALVTPSLEQGGGVPALADFLYRTIQHSKRYDVKLVSLSISAYDEISVAISRPESWLGGVRTQEGLWNGRPFIRVGAFASEFEFQRYRKRRILNQIIADCDIVQIACGSPAWANAVIGLCKPISLQVATRAKVERRRKNANAYNIIGCLRKVMTEITDHFDDRALHAVDAIQVINPWMLDYVRKINRRRSEVDIRYAPPGIDTLHFYPSIVRRPCNNNPYILCVGRLNDPRKNIELLLNAFKRLSSTLPHVQLVTAGFSYPPPAYWAQVESMGLSQRVRHVLQPSKDDLVELYQQATVFALPSDEEGLGIVILEAMACCVPVVATRCGGPEGIITDKIDGFLVPLNDSETMARCLVQLCSDSDLNLKIGQNARTTIESRFAKEITGQTFIDVWERLLQKVRER